MRLDPAEWVQRQRISQPNANVRMYGNALKCDISIAAVHLFLGKPGLLCARLHTRCSRLPGRHEAPKWGWTLCKGPSV